MYKKRCIFQNVSVWHIQDLLNYFFFYPQLAEHLVAQHSSIKMLHNRIKVILAYIQAAQKGEFDFLNFEASIYVCET